MKQKDRETWERLVQSYTDYMFASRDFLSDNVDRVSILRQILTPKNPSAASGEGLENQASSGDDLITAFRALGWLSSDELKQIFDLLISRASTAHGGILAVRQAIRSIPEEWLLDNIE